MTKKAEKKVRITLTKSPIGRSAHHRKVLKSLGLRRLHSQVEHVASPSIVGMYETISYMTRLEEI